jgi:hypothetical protein
MITPIWGAPYIERWLGLCFASLRSDGNLPHLVAHCDFELAVVTKAADAAHLRDDPRFQRLTAGMRVRFILMDEFFPRVGHTGYGVPLTLAYAKAIADLGEAGLGTFVMLMNADCVLASGSLATVLRRIRQGETIVVGQSLRAVDGSAREQLAARVDEHGVLAIPPRELMGLVNAALHSTVTARILNEPGIVEASYHHQMFWRIGEDCLAVRAFMLHPICFRLDRRLDKVVCPMDYGFLLELCPDGRLGVLDNSDDFLIIELQERDSESHLLRLAPPSSLPEPQRLPRLAREIAKVAATWTTAEHRRSARHTLYFHPRGLPRDLAQRVAPFETFVDGILARLPRPVSHLAHPHWLAAVRTYRQNMARGGSDAAIALLDQPSNDAHAQPALPATDRALRVLASAWRGRMQAWTAAHRAPAPQPPAETEDDRALRMRRELGRLVCGTIEPECATVDVVHIGAIAAQAPSPPRGARVLQLPDPSEGGSKRSFNVELGEVEHRNGALIIYVTAGFLQSWDRLAEDLDRLLQTRRQLVLVFITDQFRPLQFATHFYLLTVLGTALPARRFAATLQVYNAAPPPCPSAPQRWPSGTISALGAQVRSALARYRPARLAIETPPPTFSALVVSVRRAPPPPMG